MKDERVGRKLNSRRLADALKKKKVFTVEEWNAFGITDLQKDDVIEVTLESKQGLNPEVLVFKPTGNVYFSQDEWDHIGTADLHMEHYVKLEDDTCLVPACPEKDLQYTLHARRNCLTAGR